MSKGINDDTTKHTTRNAKQNVVLIMGASGHIGVQLIQELAKYKRRPFTAAKTFNGSGQQQDKDQIVPTVVCGFCKDPAKIDRTTKFHCGKIFQGDALNHDDVKNALIQTKANIVVIAIGDNSDHKSDTTTARTTASINVRTETARILENVLVTDPELFQHIQIVVISRADGRDATLRQQQAEAATHSSATPSRFSNAMARLQDYRIARRAAGATGEADETAATISPRKEANHRNEIASLLVNYRINHILSDHAGQEAVFLKSPLLRHRTVIVRPALSNPNTRIGMVGGLLLSYVRDTTPAGSSGQAEGSSSCVDNFYNCHFLTEWMAKKLCTIDGLAAGGGAKRRRRKANSMKPLTNNEHDDSDDASNKTPPLDDSSSSSTENSVNSYDEGDEEDHQSEEEVDNNAPTITKNQGSIVHNVWGPQGWQYYTRVQAS